MTEPAKHQPLLVQWIKNYSLLLVLGAVSALILANVAPSVHDHLVHTPLSKLLLGGEHEPKPEPPAAVPEALATDPLPPADVPSFRQGAPIVLPHVHQHVFNLEFLVNDILMAFFFAIAAKEVWEALLPGGSLANPRRAATPLLATAGGVVGPALVYLGMVHLLGQDVEVLQRGWAVPCATDIAFSLLIAKLIFGTGHPAITFLLLLAIADDAAGLVILAVFYPRGALHPEWLLLTFAAVVCGVAFQRNRVRNYWYYLLIPGVLSWLSFYWAGIHPALGLVPIIPTLPHAQTDWGIFEPREETRRDTLNAFEHAWKLPVEVILGVFGFVNAGVPLASIGAGTYVVLGGLLLGKPLGIAGMTWVAERVLRLERPPGVEYRHIWTLGMIAAIGFTVSLFVATAAFPEGIAKTELLDAVKMGALFSFLAAPLAWILGRSLGIRRGVPLTPGGNPSDV